MRAPPGTPVTRRIRGLDLARALAIIGMVMVHFGPTGPGDGGLAARAYGATHGRASILFVVLAGVGVTLLAGDRAPGRHTGLKLAYRAAVLLPLGLVLQELDTNVLVILQYYALYFLLAGAVVGLADRWLLPLAAGWTIGGPLAYLALWIARPDVLAAGGHATLTDPPARIGADLLVTGSYPVLTWMGPVLVGVWLGRRDLRASGMRWRLVVGGAALTAVASVAALLLAAWLGEPTTAPSWRQLASTEAHSQMPLWLVQATGIATAMIGICLLLADALPRLTWPLVATGQLAFTVYVGHLLMLAAWPDLLQRGTVGDAARTVAVFTLVTAVLCTAWRALLSRGPLEAVLRLPWVWRRVPATGAGDP